MGDLTHRNGRRLALALLVLIGSLAGCWRRPAAAMTLRDGETLLYEGIATPIGSPLPSVPLRLELRREAGVYHGRLQSFAESDAWRLGVTVAAERRGTTFILTERAGVGLELTLAILGETLRGSGLIFRRDLGWAQRYGIELRRVDGPFPTR